MDKIDFEMNANTKLPKEWQIKELSGIADYVTKKISVQQINIQNFISTENMLPNKNGVTVAHSLPKTGKIVRFNEGDILFSNIRTYFKKLWLAKFYGGCSNDVLVIRGNKLVDNKYLYYFLSQDIFFDFSVLTSKGTKMPRGDKTAIMEYKVNMPPLSEQKTIAKILSDFDAKIELNNQMNAALEAMAQVLFKHWFVDFEFPNEKGKPYKSSGGKMVDSELGKIPKGWMIDELGNIGKIQPGFAFKSQDFQEEGYKLIKIKNIQNSVVDVVNVEDHLSQNIFDVINKQIHLSSGDILIAMTGAELGKVGIIPKINSKMLLNQRVGKVISDHQLFMYLYLKQNVTQGLIKGISSASSAQGNISNSDIEKIRIVTDQSGDLIRQFSLVTLSIYKKLVDNLGEILILIQLRDSLLPKLMSGKIRVPLEVVENA